ncbi:heparinase II/III domain-containing protein [Nonomuraea guangzhouensis]|uniref:Heparinase II/III family protein n=1 Tax=Nonomuraea guangzhouensis TaxID=1291555 RepID=A0ABW4H0J0_9ACTN|nr:heparinase II/III family protein [Nonomuraea guangzhouensis]
MFWRARKALGRAICLADQFPTIKVPEVMAGRVTFVGLPPVDLGQDIDWRLNPHGNRSWALNLHTLRWMGRLVAEYERSGDRACLDRAESVADDWLRKNPRSDADISPWAWAEHAVALRAPALVCLSAHVDSPRLLDSLTEHGEILSDPALYRQGHNHGLDQDIGLLVVGCRLGRDGWRDLAIRRMLASAELAIDEQGVLHEQAPRYGLYVHRRLGVALRAIEESGAGIPKRLAARRSALEAYIAHATQPDGFLAPLGDSPADTRAARFAHDGVTVRVFDGGYVFGRTAWGDPESAFYSIRFGPGRRLHGHEDHLGVTYHAQGRPVLVEAGFHSYEKTDYVAWTRSPDAHNVPVVVGADFRAGRATRLDAADVGASRQSFRLSDDAYGVRRTREVLVSHGSDLMAVLDTVPEAYAVRALWHFDPSLRLVDQRDGVVVLGDDARRVTLLQLTTDGRPMGGQTVQRGTVSPGYLRTAETVTVSSPEASRLLTVIVPGSEDPAVSAEGGLITVRTPGGPVTFGGSALCRPQ